MSLAEIAPVVAVLVVAVWYFLSKEKAYQKEIAQLNQQLRDNEKDSLQLLSKLTTTIDKLLEGDSRNTADIIKEIKQLEKTLAAKIDALK